MLKMPGEFNEMLGKERESKQNNSSVTLFLKSLKQILGWRWNPIIPTNEMILCLHLFVVLSGYFRNQQYLF